jgi:hypothetical protein
MVVYRNDKGTREVLEAGGVTRAYAQAVLELEAHLVGFSTNPNGTGAWVVLPMHADDAAFYPLGTEVVFHDKKTEEIGFGDLVAVTFPPQPEPSPGP